MRSALTFIAKWALAGLAFALALVWMRPDLRSTAQQIAPAPITVFTPSKPTASPAPRVEYLVQSYADAVDKSAFAVVNIYAAVVVTQRSRQPDLENLFGDRWPSVQQRVEASLGSGVLWDAQGHVVTNNHVINNARQIKLQLADGRIADAKVVGTDPETDLALLQIKLDKLPVMALGRSDRLRVGDVALAIGCPYGLQQSVTHGIVSAIGREGREMGLSNVAFESFIQTDAAINPGSSGGALVNVQGELIGINTANLGQNSGAEGIGFAIPVDLVRGVVEQILKYGHVRRGWLGVNSQPLSPERAQELGLAQNSGVELFEVYADSPAARAGLQVGDVIIALDGVAVGDPRQAMSRVASLSPGKQLRVRARRGKETLEVRVKVEERRPSLDAAP